VVPLLGRPFLAYQLALLRAHGVTDVILACSYRVDDVKQALGEAEHLGVRLRYVVETEPLGTGGGVRNAADLARGTVFVLNGDVLTDADLTAMRAFHESHGSRTTIFLTRVADPRAYGLVELHADAQLARFREKPTAEEPITTDTINAGVYLIDAALLARMPSGKAVSIEREFFPALIADGVPSYGWIADSYWRDIGSPAAYRAAQLDMLDGRVRTALEPPGRQVQTGVWLGHGVEVAADAAIAAPAVIGDGTRVAAGAVVGPHAVVGRGCRIGPRARVTQAILWERVSLGEHAVAAGCVLGDDVRVGAHAEVGAGVVLESGAVVAERSKLPG
jgi:NDP-sugar pyrophosphorylase family protein